MNDADVARRTINTSKPRRDGRSVSTVDEGRAGGDTGSVLTAEWYPAGNLAPMVARPPSIDALAAALDDGTVPRALLVEVARRAVAEWRADPEGVPSPDETAQSAVASLRMRRPGRVINATGVLLHTNLGRAAMAPRAADAARDASVGFAALEFDLATGRRGGRGSYVADLLRAVTGAEAGLAVNNNAGALYLTVTALAGGRTVIVSRGELIEIGGSFRLPDLMAATGAMLREVGTTNRTRIVDYRAAIDHNAGLLLKVHPSNYRIEGFAEEVGYAALGALAGECGLPFVADVGSGLLDGRVPWLDGPPPAWLAEEPAVRQTLEAGADLVLFSGDKLLGGPQAGIVVGTADAVAALARHPVARAVRIDGPRLASLAITLEMYASGRGGEIPFWRWASLGDEVLDDRCRSVLAASGVGGEVVTGRSLPGAGSVPGRGIPGPVLLVPGAGDAAWRTLLEASPPIVARREERGLVVDLRAVKPDDDAVVARGLAGACR
jgi:L-seryl-tRNA(Ser) seleniumtransferase